MVAVLAGVEAGQGGQDEANASAALFVDGVGQADPAHLFEQALDPFAQFLADTQVRADAGDPRVPGEPADQQR